MKYILIILAFISTTASAQIDSGSYMLPFQMKQKFAKVLMPNPVKLADQRYADSLIKAIGSGDTANGKPDSVSVIGIKISTYMVYAEKIATMEVGAAYDFGVEFFTAPLVVNGYSGTLATLQYYANFGTANQKIAALWGYKRALDLINRKKAVLTEEMQAGLDRAKAIKAQVFN